MLHKDVQFTIDMSRAGQTVISYFDRPAVRVGHQSLQDVIRATALQLQWDTDCQDVKGLVIYPAQDQARLQERL